MGFFDDLLSTATFGISSAISDMINKPSQIWDENRAVNNQKELIDHQTGRSKELQEHQAELGKNVFDYTFGKEASLNDYLMRTSPATQKSAMISAGVNPASQFGAFSGNLAQSSAPSFAGSAGGASAPIGGKSFSIGELLGAKASLEQANLLKQQARKLKLENDATEEENVFYSKFNDYYDWDVQNGKLVAKPIDPNTPLPAIFSSSLKTRKGVEAKFLSFGRLMADKSNLETVMSQNELQKRVADGQLRNNKVINALVTMPENDYNKVVEQINNLKKDRQIKELQIEYDKKRNNFELPEQELQILEKKIKEETNIRLILDKFMDGSWSIGDLVYLLLAVSLK